MHENDILRQLLQHRWHKHFLNVYISTLKQTGCILYRISTKLTPGTGYEKLLQTLCKLQIKRLGICDFSGQKLGRVGKQETQGFSLA
jgi:hypothetical protein